MLLMDVASGHFRQETSIIAISEYSLYCFTSAFLYVLLETSRLWSFLLAYAACVLVVFLGNFQESFGVPPNE